MYNQAAFILYFLHIESNHRNPSKHRLEEHAMLNWVKQLRKLHNAEAARYLSPRQELEVVNYIYCISTGTDCKVRTGAKELITQPPGELGGTIA